MTRPELTTINDVLHVMRDRNLPNVVVRKVGGEWQAISAAQMYGYVASFASVLRSWGLQKGDRVAIIAENRVEWAITDFACLGIGAVDVPIYATLTAEQMAFILQNSEAKIAVVSTRTQAQKLQSMPAARGLAHVVVMDDITGEFGTEDFWRLIAQSGDHNAEFEQWSGEVGPEDLATIIYTSGTTGTPKGVMLTHGNEASNLMFSTHEFGWGVGWRVVSFLPLSHITARHVDYCFYRAGVTIAYCPDINEIVAAFKETMPSIVVGVPRVYEKVRQEAIRRAGTGTRRKVFDWAFRVGARHRDEILENRTPAALTWKIADKLVFSKLRGAFGGKTQSFISGGAPLGIDTAQWYADAGIRILEGYGLTETSPVIAVNTTKEYKIGSVGKPLPNIECRIADDGELLVRGPSVFKGYWRSLEETAAAFDGDWFKTGDIANLDADGYLSITDRKKDLMKTSGGKFIAPQPIESKLKLDPLVAQAVMIGDRRKFAMVIVQPSFSLLEGWAQQKSVPYSSRRELVERPEVKALYKAIVDKVNAELARFETMKRIIIVPDEFTVESGELTPSMKLKRRVVEKRYSHEIEATYALAGPVGGT